MKRTFFAFVALLAAAAGVFVVTLATTLPTARQVTFSVNPRYTVGDPAHAQGLRLVAETQMGGHLHWTTTFTPAASPDCETQFRFSAQSEPVPYQARNTAPQLVIAPYVNIYAPTEDLLQLSALSQSPYRALIRDMASRAPAGGGSYTQTVTLSDYLDFCPISVECYDWPGLGSANYQSVDLSSVFPIPLAPGVEAETTVTVQPDGTISSFSLYAQELPYLTVQVVYFQDAFYVAFPYADLEEDLGQTDITPGLYRLPLVTTQDGITTVDVSQVELVAALDAPAQSMTLIGQGPQLALVTSATRSHSNQLTLWDLSSATKRQQFDLGSTDWCHGLFAAEDHIIYMGSQREVPASPQVLLVWRLGEDGTFIPFLSTTYPDNMPLYGGSSISSLFCGDTLYTLSYPQNGDCTWITVAVFDPQGCRYAADLTLSQHYDSSSTQYPVTLTDLRLEYTPPQ